MDSKTLANFLRKLDEQSFRPDDSVVASTINHPIDAIGKFGGWLANQVNTAAGIPDQYDNPYPYLAPSPEAQTQAAFDVAGMAQLGSMPFAPKSAGGTVGTLARPAEPLDDNLNAELLQKYLQQGSLTPDELAQYERNAVAMRDSNRQYLNVANADAQGGTAMERAKDMGFIEKPMYHGTSADFPEFSLFEGGGVSRSPVGKLGVSLADNPDLANEFSALAAQKEGDQAQNAGANVLPLLHRITRGASMQLDDDVLNSEVFGAVVDAQKQGIDAIKMNNYTTPSGAKLGPAYLIQNPNQIRSRFAAFDPLRKDSADLLATKLLPASMLGLGMYGMEQERRNPLAEALRGQ